jgi:general secretion pathway protein D
VKKTAALLLVIGLVCLSAAYAQTMPGETDSPFAAKPTPDAVEPAADTSPAVDSAPNTYESAPDLPIAAEPTLDTFKPAPDVPVAVEPAPAASATPDQAGSSNTKPGDDYITLNFTNIDINALIKVMSELTRRNFILDERVKGKVTLMTPTKMSPDEAYQVFLSALEIKGFTAVEDGMVTRIIPASTARQSGLKVFQDGDTHGQGFVTRLIRLKIVNPQDIVRAITPLVTKNGTMIAYPNTNSIIITDSVYNIRKIESLIQLMDVAAPEGKGKINVYYLKNANAEDIAKLLAALVARLPVRPPGGAKKTTTASILEGRVNISADKATNSLIIVALPEDYELMKDVVQKLDIRRRQVYVEAAIIEMSLAKQRDLGFEMQVPISQNQFDAGETIAVGGTNFGGIGNAVSGPAGFASMNGLAVGAVKGTFTFKGIEYLSVGALLRAMQTDADINVLSTPNILTTDNQKAKIMVGENIPFVGSQTQSAATGGNTTFNIVRKDVGISLEITPQITSDDNVRLEINQEISAVIATPGLDPNEVGPSTSKRSASTTVVVKDRETMVIGGLIRDNVTSSTMKVPLLGDIPILGWFFKYKTSKVEKTNLMIFITPYIIKTAEESAALTRHKEGVLEDFREKYHIEKKDKQPPIQLDETGSGEEPAVVAPALGPSTPEQEVESSVSSTQVPVNTEVPKAGVR